MYDIYSEFDLKMHKKIFKNYLEVILFSDGHIEYAIPSHQEKLIKICCDKLHINRNELNDMCPKEYYADFIVWLCNISGCISIWNNFIMTSDKFEPTIEQIETLRILKKENLYYGKLGW